MQFFCKQFVTNNVSFLPKRPAMMGETAKEAPKEAPKAATESVDEGALQQAKRDYSERWETLKKFRDKDPNVMEGLTDEALQKLSVRADLVVKEFQKQLKADKDLVDPEKVFSPDVKDKERVQGTLVVLDQIIEKYGSEKQGAAPEWLTEAVLKKPRENFNKALAMAMDKIKHLRNPIMGGGDTEKNPYTNDYVHNSAALAMFDSLSSRYATLNQSVQSSKNADFINAATLDVNGIDAELDRICRFEQGSGQAAWAIEEALMGSSHGKGWEYLPKTSQTDSVLLDHIQARLKYLPADIEKIPAGTTWTIEKRGISFTVTKGEGRQCTAKINNVGIWIVEQHGASFVKYLTPEDRRMVKSFNESTGAVVVERRYPLSADAVPAAVASQYPKLDPEFDKDPSPKRVTVGEETYEVARLIVSGKKTYKVEKVEPPVAA